MDVNSDLNRVDADIAAALRCAIAGLASVPEAQIHSSVSDRWVTLEGEVETYDQRNDVARAARGLTGVIGVRNWIVVERPFVEPGEIHGLIEGVLERRACRLADRIEVSVDGGEVTLDGVVRSAAEKAALLSSVGHARGVFSINDRLRIQADE